MHTISPLSLRLFVLLITSVIAVNAVFANTIDSLKTRDDVEHFMVQKVGKQWDRYSIFSSRDSISKKSGKGTFFKEDLDKNGLTDLVVNGNLLFAVLDKGNEQYESFLIDEGTFLLDKHTLINILHIDNTPLLVVNDYNEYFDTIRNGAKPDTLIYAFNDFIEYNAKPQEVKIETIKFSTSHCYGSCPVFDITIQPDRKAIYNGIIHNKKNGKFKGTIDPATYRELVSTLQYINLPSLQNRYSVDWTDDQTVTLEVTFKDGQTKGIRDYGAIGTFGLKSVYKKIFALRESQNWKKVR